MLLYIFWNTIQPWKWVGYTEAYECVVWWHACSNTQDWGVKQNIQQQENRANTLHCRFPFFLKWEILQTHTWEEPELTSQGRASHSVIAKPVRIIWGPCQKERCLAPRWLSCITISWWDWGSIIKSPADSHAQQTMKTCSKAWLNLKEDGSSLTSEVSYCLKHHQRPLTV